MEEINPTDWSRIFLGNAPPEFYLELIIRALLIYSLLMFSMRMLGKRMSSQISRVEMAAMTAFASAVGVPMLSPINGILPSFVIAVFIILITKLIAKISYGNQEFERVTQGNVDCLVVDAVMQPANMERVRISRERLFAQLRSECIDHLGMVKRVYLEANGTFTIISTDNPQPGLIVLPLFDREFIEEKVRDTEVTICGNCGNKKPENAGKATCDNCREEMWTKGVVSI